jgi:hypothetical protein
MDSIARSMASCIRSGRSIGPRAACPAAGSSLGSVRENEAASEEPLINKDIERHRLLYVYKTLIDTPEARELGLGDVSDNRLKSAITTIATSFELPQMPPPGDIFDHSFLPPKASRMPEVTVP